MMPLPPPRSAMPPSLSSTVLLGIPLKAPIMATSTAVLVLLLLLFANPKVWSAVELPEEELARETVLPKFRTTAVVKARNIVTENRWEAGVHYGWNFTEPIYGQNRFGLDLGYHWSEISAVVVNFSVLGAQLNTQYTDAIAQQSSVPIDFNRIPKQKLSIYPHYEYKSYYGKISLTKKGILNFSLYPLLGVGLTQFEHKVYPGMDIGVGMKFYFTKFLALRTDLKLQVTQTLNPFAKTALQTSSTPPQSSQFKDRVAINTLFDLGMSFLL